MGDSSLDFSTNGAQSLNLQNYLRFKKVNPNVDALNEDISFIRRPSKIDFECGQCGRSFSAYGDLKAHRNDHEKLISKTKDGISCHNRKEHQMKRFFQKSPIDSGSVGGIDELDGFQAIEPTVNTESTSHGLPSGGLVCQICNFKAKSKGGLKRHKKVHVQKADLLMNSQILGDSNVTDPLVFSNKIYRRDKFICPNCSDDNPRSFNSLRGLRIHNTKCHPNSQIPQISWGQAGEILVINEDNITEENFLKLFELKAKVGVLKRIPKGARPMAAKTYTQLIRNCISNNDLSSWLNLFTFAFKAFHIPSSKKQGAKQSLVSIVKENISSLQVPQDQRNNLKTSNFYKRVESKVADFDVKGAVKLLSSDESFAPANVQTLYILQSKHPQPSRPQFMPQPPINSENCLQVSTLQVKKSISSFSNGSGSGPDGFRPQYFKDLISISAGDAGTEVLTAITDLCNFMLRGLVNKVVCKYLYGGVLCAFNKEIGGIRPIAIGLSIRRLTSKLACKHADEVIGDYFGCKQLGFKVKQGCEGAVHATRTYLSNSKGSRKVLLKIDYNNAFNSSERDNMLNGVKLKTPLLFKYFWQCYSEPSLLSYDSNVIISAVGAQQGDPAGGLLFSLSLQPVIDEIESDLNLWYLDDGTLCDVPEVVIEDFHHLIELSKERGLEVNPAKCEIYFCSGVVDKEILTQFQEIAPGIRVMNEENLCLLGVPIFESAFTSVASSLLNTANRMFDRLKNLPAHTAFFLLKNCFAIPKLTYFLRSFPTWKFDEFTNAFDDLIRTTLNSILNINLEEKSWKQATLPISVGGLGIRCVKDISLPAFLSSAHAAMTIVSHINHTSDDNHISHMQESILAWNHLNISSPVLPTVQRHWDIINVNRIISNELIFTNPYDIARFKALQRKESNAWLNAFPSKHIGMFMDNNSIRICMALRLGSSICLPHRCVCGTSVNHLGIHGLSCQKSAGRFSRHAELNKIICQALCLINVPSILEPPGMFRNDGKRADGLTLIPWSHGKCLVWDSTCVDTFADSNIRMSTSAAGRAAELAARNKHDKYEEIKSNNYIFNAFAVETMGTWSTEALNLANKIGSMLIEKSGDNRAKDYFFQRLSMAIQRANTTCIMGSLPPTTKLDEVFYL